MKKIKQGDVLDSEWLGALLYPEWSGKAFLQSGVLNSSEDEAICTELKLGSSSGRGMFQSRVPRAMTTLDYSITIVRLVCLVGSKEFWILFCG